MKNKRGKNLSHNNKVVQRGDKSAKRGGVLARPRLVFFFFFGQIFFFAVVVVESSARIKALMLADRETRDSYGYTKWPTKRKKKEKSKDFVPIHHEQERETCAWKTSSGEDEFCSAEVIGGLSH